MLQTAMDKETDKNMRADLAIFRAAISQTDLSKLDTDAELVNAHRIGIQG